MWRPPFSAAEVGVVRIIFQLLGIGFVVLAAIGAVLPLMPSTPFLLLATSCFLRSSPAWNERLLRSPVFGPMLRDWQTHRMIRPRAKLLAIGGMFALGSGSLLWGDFSRPVAVVVLVLLCCAAGIVLSFRTTPREPLPQWEPTL